MGKTVEIPLYKQHVVHLIYTKEVGLADCISSGWSDSEQILE